VPAYAMMSRLFPSGCSADSKYLFNEVTVFCHELSRKKKLHGLCCISINSDRNVLAMIV
jgi:hypothetical protein